MLRVISFVEIYFVIGMYRWFAYFKFFFKPMWYKKKTLHSKFQILKRNVERDKHPNCFIWVIHVFIRAVDLDDIHESLQYLDYHVKHGEIYPLTACLIGSMFSLKFKDRNNLRRFLILFILSVHCQRNLKMYLPGMC